jgi:hypothetical protein
MGTGPGRILLPALNPYPICRYRGYWFCLATHISSVPLILHFPPRHACQCHLCLSAPQTHTAASAPLRHVSTPTPVTPLSPAISSPPSPRPQPYELTPPPLPLSLATTSPHKSENKVHSHHARSAQYCGQDMGTCAGQRTDMRMMTNPEEHPPAHKFHL